jgi:hypothetical protein
MLSVIKSIRIPNVKEVNADEKYYTPYNLTQLVNPKAVIKEQNPSIKNVVGITYWRGNPDHEKRTSA